MPHSATLQSLLCPRCTAPVARGETACRRCGQAVAPGPDGRLRAVGTVCPRCNRPAEPGRNFVSAAGVSEAGTCGHCGSALEAEAAEGVSGYVEEKAESCAPFDIERLARAEAVDGWSLWDTTVDPARPGMILAHFRRPAREAPPQVRPAAGKPDGTRSQAPDRTSVDRTVPDLAPQSPPDPHPRRTLSLDWAMPHQAAAIAVAPLVAALRLSPHATIGDFFIALISLGLAVAVYATVFSIAMTMVLLAKLFRAGGFLAFAVVLPVVFGIVFATITRSAAGRRAVRMLGGGRGIARVRHGVAWQKR